jgi:tetratricopeptide (TPR) repeat protein
LPLVASVDQAEGLFQNAATFMAAGKYEEGLKDYLAITQDFPQSPYAPRALLAMGQHYQQEGKDLAKAMALFQSIVTEFPQADVAPMAYFLRTKIQAREAATFEDLGQSANELQRMLALYPNHSLEGDARFLLGMISFQLEQPSEAERSFVQVALHHRDLFYEQSGPYYLALMAFFKGDKDRSLQLLSDWQSHLHHPATLQNSRHLAYWIYRTRGNPSTCSAAAGFDYAQAKSLKRPWDGVDFFGVMVLLDQNGKQFSGPESALGTMVRWPGEVTMVSRNALGPVLAASESRVHVCPDLSTMNSFSPSAGKIVSLDADGLNRLFLVAGDDRQVHVFRKDGELLQKIGPMKAAKIRCSRNQPVILDQKEQDLLIFSSDLSQSRKLISLPKITDFAFDVLGNMAVAYNKGESFAIYDHRMRPMVEMPGLGPSLSLKGVDVVFWTREGHLVLADRRNGMAQKVLWEVKE